MLHQKNVIYSPDGEPSTDLDLFQVHCPSLIKDLSLSEYTMYFRLASRQKIQDKKQLAAGLSRRPIAFFKSDFSEKDIDTLDNLVYRRFLSYRPQSPRPCAGTPMEHLHHAYYLEPMALYNFSNGLIQPVLELPGIFRISVQVMSSAVLSEDKDAKQAFMSVSERTLTYNTTSLISAYEMAAVELREDYVLPNFWEKAKLISVTAPYNLF